jgi:pyruvate formate-lyase activating enzyme-like uncharacterized protein
MKYISKQEAFANKYARQQKLLEYSPLFKLHCGGAAAHYGKIPKGCAGCFFNTIQTVGVFVGMSVGLPNVCNANCKHCFTKLGGTTADRNMGCSAQLPINIDEHLEKYISDTGIYGKYRLVGESSKFNGDFTLYSFGGEGSEPLLYLPVLEKMMNHFKGVQEYINKPAVYKLYTNGKLLTTDVIDRLAVAGITELRINPSAFMFTDEIYENIQRACKVFPVVTTEVAVFPEYYEYLETLLPISDEIGVSHISLCQMKYKDEAMFTDNVKFFSETTEYYQASNDWLVVDDGGVVETLIKTAIDKQYRFSILDCNAMMLAQECYSVGIGKTLNSLDFTGLINTTTTLHQDSV